MNCEVQREGCLGEATCHITDGGEFHLCDNCASKTLKGKLLEMHEKAMADQRAFSAFWKTAEEQAEGQSKRLVAWVAWLAGRSSK